MNKTYKETFNDGFFEYGFYKTQRSESRKITGKLFSPEGKLAYSKMSARDQDYQLAAALGGKLDLKLKTLFPPFFRKIRKSKLKVKLDDMFFDVIRVDEDNQSRYLYFYLQEVGENDGESQSQN